MHLRYRWPERRAREVGINQVAWRPWGGVESAVCLCRDACQSLEQGELHRFQRHPLLLQALLPQVNRVGGAPGSKRSVSPAPWQAIRILSLQGDAPP